MCLEGFCQRHSSHDLIEREDLGKNLQSVEGSSLMVVEVLRMVQRQTSKMCDISAHSTSVSLLKVAKNGNYLLYDSSCQK